MDMAGPNRLVTIRDPRNCYVAELREMDALTYRNGQIEANAKLIAAAPTLLRELEALLNIVEDSERIECVDLLTGTERGEVRRAIAQAKGEKYPA